MIVINGNSSLLEEFYGELPRQSTKTVVVMDKGKPIAVAGLRVDDAKTVLFSDISDELRESPKFKRIIIKGYRKILRLFPGMPVYSRADPDIKGSDRLLEHMGFYNVKGDIWRN